MNLLKGIKSGVLSSHLHPNAIQVCVLKGKLYYLEHDWEAKEGSYVYELPGEKYTLVVLEDVKEMITFFQVNGIMSYVDLWDMLLGYEDVFTKIDLYRKHFIIVGLGKNYVDQFTR